MKEHVTDKKNRVHRYINIIPEPWKMLGIKLTCVHVLMVLSVKF